MYRQQTTPLVSYYFKRSLLIEVDGSALPAAVYNRIREALPGQNKPTADTKI